MSQGSIAWRPSTPCTDVMGTAGGWVVERKRGGRNTQKTTSVDERQQGGVAAMVGGFVFGIADRRTERSDRVIWALYGARECVPGERDMLICHRASTLVNAAGAAVAGHPVRVHALHSTI